jgi:hypothetical protein
VEETCSENGTWDDAETQHVAKTQNTKATWVENLTAGVANAQQWCPEQNRHDFCYSRALLDTARAPARRKARQKKTKKGVA